MPVTNVTPGGTTVNVPYGMGAAAALPGNQPSPQLQAYGGFSPGSLTAKPTPPPPSTITLPTSAIEGLGNQAMGVTSTPSAVNTTPPTNQAPPAATLTPDPDQGYQDPPYWANVAAINHTMQNSLGNANLAYNTAQATEGRNIDILNQNQPALRLKMLNAAGVLTSGLVGYRGDLLNRDYLNQAGTINDRLAAAKAAWQLVAESPEQAAIDQLPVGSAYLTRDDAIALEVINALGRQAKLLPTTSTPTSTPTTGGGGTKGGGTTGGGTTGSKGKTPPVNPRPPQNTRPTVRQRAANQAALRRSRYARTAPPGAFS